MGPGYGVHTFSRGYPYGTAFAQRGSSAARGRNLLILVLTLIIPFIYSLLSSIINGHPPPDYEFFPSLHHSQKHTTHLYGVDYWINGDEWNRWLGSIGVNPNIHVTTTENGRTRKMWAQNAVIPEKLKNYEYNIIRSYRVSLTNACGEERLRKRDLINKSKGLFRTDKKMLARAESMILHNCNLLNDLNNRIRSASGGG